MVSKISKYKYDFRISNYEDDFIGKDEHRFSYKVSNQLEEKKRCKN